MFAKKKSQINVSSSESSEDPNLYSSMNCPFLGFRLNKINKDSKMEHNTEKSKS